MPTYEYRCKDCGHEFEAQQAFTDDPLTDCPTVQRHPQEEVRVGRDLLQGQWLLQERQPWVVLERVKRICRQHWLLEQRLLIGRLRCDILASTGLTVSAINCEHPGEHPGPGPFGTLVDKRLSPFALSQMSGSP